MKKKSFVLIVGVALVFAQMVCAYAEDETAEGTAKSQSEPAAELSVDDLRRILPVLARPFPVAADPKEFLPDGKPETAVHRHDSPWLYLKAMQQGYSEVTDVLFDTDTNEWFIVVNGKNFFWSEGRILPEAEKDLGGKYRSFFPYDYEKRIFQVSRDEKEVFANLLANQKKSTAKQNSLQSNTFFFSEIYGEVSENAVQKKLRAIAFLGSTVYVHERIVPSLLAVNAEISALKKAKQYKSFFSNYLTTYGFNWRTIEYGDTLSLHALGIAVDVMAKRYGKLNAFWYWESKVHDEWFLLTPEQRWMPPLDVINAFDRQGFVWGGYWALWDTMHFEYRPEQIFACDFAFSETERFYTDADIERLETAEKEAVAKNEKAAAAQNKKETEVQPSNDSSAQNDQNSENAEDKSVQNKNEEAQ